LKISCRNLSEANIKLSLNGEVKLGINILIILNVIKLTYPIVLALQELQHDHLQENSKVSQVLLDFPVLAEIIEEMMLSRYHLVSEDQKWSEDALSFLSCTLSGSLETLEKARVY
jgi:hypothetical protein